ncbi:Cupredoxin [Pseudomassariella vexata]|uniref:Cupredoxin n=1 Tax=Pseudomassariella vexata TaxID=1141098 RepID=A0A1Y2E8D7_9PEZI|nr:Cupredoxin [Pseudomassariella vexata]ORY67546.1 Cupredoxin [Pseudomassariella vexata]
MDYKASIEIDFEKGKPLKRSSTLRSVFFSPTFFIVSAVVLALGLFNHDIFGIQWPLWLYGKATQADQLVRHYNLEFGTRWMNPDGGRWRVMLTCNGESPCPTLYAEEGDLIALHLQNDMYAQNSIHISGLHYPNRAGPWNEGTGGISQYPTLSRGNFSTVHDTTDQWGLRWYIEHTTAGSVDGLYGVVWIAPSPSRPRPYHLITSDPIELRKIKEAESRIQHLDIKNHQHRDTGWKLLRMKAEGSEFYCYDSIIINGHGRVHCRHPDYAQLNGQSLDEKGCIQPPGLPAESCKPSTAPYEIIETNGQSYIMMNLINLGFEHSVMVSIDDHKMIVVANDNGFTEPYETDVVYITNAARVTVLVKLDREPGDYTMRYISTSILQNLQGYSILRYPGIRKQPMLGQPMELPQPPANSIVCVLPDGSVDPRCKQVDLNYVPPYPASPIPTSRHKAPIDADFTFHLTTGVQPSLTQPHVPEFYLNKKPWQLFRSAMKPLLLVNLTQDYDTLEAPIIKDLPLGSVVDLIIHNDLNESISLYKHGAPSWLMGSAANDLFEYSTVREAVEDGKALNLENPGRVISHDLPPLGWTVNRFQVTSKMAGMIHSGKLKYFALGMAAPILEGITPEDPLDAPAGALNRPHIEFKPKNDGIFG